METSTRAPHAAVKWLACLAAPILAFTLLELGVRAAGWAPPLDPPALRIRRTVEQDTGLWSGESTHRFRRGWLWEPRPGAEFEGDVISEHACRGPTYALEPRPALRVLAVGESATFGMRVPDSDSWPRILEARLRSTGIDAQVLNFGVIGHTVCQGLERYRRELTRWRPDVVVACFGGRNELSPAPDARTDAQRIAHVDSLQARGLEIASSSALVRWLSALRADAAPSNERLEIERTPWGEFEAALESWSRETARDGVQLVWLLPAYRRDTEALSESLAACRERIRAKTEALGVPLADVAAVLEERGDAARMFLDRAHPSREGAESFAQIVEATLRAAALTPQPAE